MESTHAQLAANARAQLETTDQMLVVLAAKIESVSAELETLATERANLQADWNDRQSLILAAKQDQERKSVEASVAVGTLAEAATQRALADAEALVTALEADLRGLEGLHGVAEVELLASPREEYLRNQRQAVLAEREKLLARRAQLEQIYTQSHEAHGREVYQAARAEAVELEKQVSETTARLKKRERALADHRAGMAARFADWPTLANEVSLAYQPAPDDTAARLLQAADAFLAVAEAELGKLPHDMNHPNPVVGSYQFFGLLNLVSLSGKEWGQAHYHAVNRSPESYWPMQTFTQRRQTIQQALREHTAGSRRTTPSELQRIENKLRELAKVSD